MVEEERKEGERDGVAIVTQKNQPLFTFVVLTLRFLSKTNSISSSY